MVQYVASVGTLGICSAVCILQRLVYVGLMADGVLPIITFVLPAEFSSNEHGNTAWFFAVSASSLARYPRMDRAMTYLNIVETL